MRQSKDFSAKDVKILGENLDGSDDGNNEFNKNRPVTANTINQKEAHVKDFTLKSGGALKQSNWQLKSVFDIKSTENMNYTDDK